MGLMREESRGKECLAFFGTSPSSYVRLYIELPYINIPLNEVSLDELYASPTFVKPQMKNENCNGFFCHRLAQSESAVCD